MELLNPQTRKLRPLHAELSLADLDRTHRLGKRKPTDNSSRPRPIIVKFTSYRVRSSVFRSKRKLKNSGISVSENLTPLRSSLLREAKAHDAVETAWTTDGRIVCLLKNSKKVTVTNVAGLKTLH